MSKTSTQTDSDIHLIVTLFTTVGNTRCSWGRLTISFKMDWTISRDVGLGNVPLSQPILYQPTVNKCRTCCRLYNRDKSYNCLDEYAPTHESSAGS